VDGFEERLAKLPQFDRAVQKLRRIYVSGAVECDVDDSGRILVPPTLREHAGLEKDVLWAGSGKYAELWDKARWKQHFETTEDERVEIASRLAELGPMSGRAQRHSSPSRSRGGREAEAEWTGRRTRWRMP
jgi:MraZ protein